MEVNAGQVEGFNFYLAIVWNWGVRTLAWCGLASGWSG